MTFTEGLLAMVVADMNVLGPVAALRQLAQGGDRVIHNRAVSRTAPSAAQSGAPLGPEATSIPLTGLANGSGSTAGSTPVSGASSPEVIHNRWAA